ncbi:MAG: hypothetical protein AAB380_01195 [Verrucomicrobiota bacterium]
MAGRKTFVGFGFGAIQTGLFLWEAQQSGNFERLVIAMTNDDVVAGLRCAGGNFHVNVATRTAREVCEIRGVEIFNPHAARDRQSLVEAIAEASEMSTALPSVETYEQPDASVAELLAEGLRAKLRQNSPTRCILYAAENHNHAAELLRASLSKRLTSEEDQTLHSVFQPLNTVIGKMSRVVRDAAEIKEAGLQPYVDGGSRAYLVEAFNRILVSKVTQPGFKRGIAVLAEKPDLLPFEEAKLYGHNAAHALLGYLGRQRGLRFIAEAAADDQLMTFVREAFLDESGRALIARWLGVDLLFTSDGYRAFADDLLERMVNPWLRDSVERETRDPRRKLGWDDRLGGTMRLALAAGIQPSRLAVGAAAALERLQSEEPTRTKGGLLDDIWANANASPDEKHKVRSLILTAKG